MFRSALAFLQAGQVADAERSFKQVLRAYPTHAGALNLLAILTMQTGRLAEAEDYARRALKETPGSDVTLYNYGLILKSLGQPAEALQRYNEALAINPAVPETWNNRGVTFNDLKRYRDAIADFDKALSIKANYPDALCNKGKALAGLSLYDQALAAYDKALALNPALAEAWIGRGNTYYELKRYDEALGAYDKAAGIKRDLADAWLGRGNVYVRLRQYDDALAAYDKALASRPRFAEAWLGRGNVNLALKRYDEAFEDYGRALQIKPDFAEVWLGRGNIAFELNGPDDAQAAYDKALALNPELPSAWVARGNIDYGFFRYDQADAAYNKALALRPDLAEAWVGRGNLLVRLQRHDEAVGAYDRALAIDPGLKYVAGDRLHAKQFICDWASLEPDISRLLADVREGRIACAPFALVSVPSSAAEPLRCAQLFVADKYPAMPPLWRGERYKHDRIRIAYLSADFRDHATSHLVAGMFECHEKSRFEITAVSWGPDDNSDMRKRIIKSSDRFVDVRLQGQTRIAELLCEMEIDIVVDLMGFTHNSRTGIFAMRPAPIQVNYLGYPGTLGSDYFDYMIADETVIPDDQRAFYSEQVVWLPDCYQANDRQRHVAEGVPTRSDCGLPDNGFVFCSFNNAYKIMPDVFDVWMRLLRQVEGSVLWLIEANAMTSKNLRREAEQRGVVAERLIFAPRKPLPDHLARHRLAGLFLDTLPCNAHTTASDSLWAGLPVVTCLGATFAGRVAASLLKAAGLKDLVTANLADYETLALALARDPARLAALKAKLASERQSCPLFDTPRFTRQIESAYVTMWERYQRGEPPVHFAVDAIKPA
jgi:predicted O-linked N-acetylglucosamine transferase (SPINDLY family)